MPDASPGTSKFRALSESASAPAIGQTSLRLLWRRVLSSYFGISLRKQLLLVTQLARGIVGHGCIHIVRVHCDLTLTLAIVVVRTVSLFRLKVVALIVLHCLAAS